MPLALQQCNSCTAYSQLHHPSPLTSQLATGDSLDSSSSGLCVRLRLAPGPPSPTVTAPVPPPSTGRTAYVYVCSTEVQKYITSSTLLLLGHRCHAD